MLRRAKPRQRPSSRPPRARLFDGEEVTPVPTATVTTQTGRYGVEVRYVNSQGTGSIWQGSFISLSKGDAERDARRFVELYMRPQTINDIVSVFIR